LQRLIQLIDVMQCLVKKMINLLLFSFPSINPNNFICPFIYTLSFILFSTSSIIGPTYWIFDWIVIKN